MAPINPRFIRASLQLRARKTTLHCDETLHPGAPEIAGPELLMLVLPLRADLCS
jgi:hypothetical protein